MPGASKPIATFTRKHPVSGDTQTRDAYTEEQRVNLTADGWVEKKTSSTSSTSSAADKPAGGKPNNS